MRNTLPRLEFKSDDGDVRVIRERHTDGILISTTDIETVYKTGERRNFPKHSSNTLNPITPSVTGTTHVPPKR